MKIVIVSGYFNPVHKGHIEYFNKSKEHGDKLYVIVNNDKQRELKGSKEFQSEDERMFIVQNLKMVDPLGHIKFDFGAVRFACATRF